VRCEICQSDPDTLLIIPMHQSNGSLCTVACEECAIKQGFYCIDHSKIHIGFNDGSHACPACVSELCRYLSQLDLETRFTSRILAIIPEKQRDSVMDWGITIISHLQISWPYCLLHALACKCMRNKSLDLPTEPEYIVTQIEQAGNISLILPDEVLEVFSPS